MNFSQQLHRIHSLLSEIDAAYHQAAVHLHLSDSALLVLYVLQDYGDGCPLRAVYQQYNMSKQTLNSAIRKLEAAGFLYLEPGDGRGKNIRLTCSGKQCMETTARRLSEAEQRVFSNWEEEDRAAYARLLEKHLQDFQKELTSL